MNDSFLMNNLNSLDHLNSDMKNCFKVEFTMTLLEKVFKTLTKLIHNHNVEHFTVFSFLITNEVKIWHGGFSSKLMDEF